MLRSFAYSSPGNLSPLDKECVVADHLLLSLSIPGSFPLQTSLHLNLLLRVLGNVLNRNEAPPSILLRPGLRLCDGQSGLNRVALPENSFNQDLFAEIVIKRTVIIPILAIQRIVTQGQLSSKRIHTVINK